LDELLNQHFRTTLALNAGTHKVDKCEISLDLYRCLCGFSVRC